MAPERCLGILDSLQEAIIDAGKGKIAGYAALILRTRVWVSATPTVPRPDAVHLDLEGEAEQDSYDHDHAQHNNALDGLLNDDRLDDVGHDQHLEAEQDAPT